MQQRDRDYIRDIVQSAEMALSYVEDVDLVRFLGDDLLQDGCIRRLEIIGEAARRISAGMKDRYSNLPWIEMIGMRNLMIHEYAKVDPVVVWKTVTQDLPHLLKLLETNFADNSV